MARSKSVHWFVLRHTFYILLSNQVFGQQTEVFSFFDRVPTVRAERYINVAGSYYAGNISWDAKLDQIVSNQNVIKEAVEKMTKTVYASTKNQAAFFDLMMYKVDSLIKTANRSDQKLDSTLSRVKQLLVESKAVVNEGGKANYLYDKLYLNVNDISHRKDLVFKNDFGGGDLAPKFDNTNYGYVDKRGNVVIKFMYDTAGRFGNGMAPIRKNKQWKYINSEGKTVRVYGDSVAKCFSYYSGYALIKKKRNDRVYYDIIDANDVRVRNVPYEFVWTNDEWHIFKHDGKHYVYRYDGWIMGDKKEIYGCKEIVGINEDIAVYSIDGKSFAAFDLNSNEVLINDPAFARLELFVQHYSIATLPSGKKSIIDTYNHGLFPYAYCEVNRASQDIFEVKFKRGPFGTRNTSFTIITNNKGAQCVSGNCKYYERIKRS